MSEHSAIKAPAANSSTTAAAETVSVSANEMPAARVPSFLPIQCKLTIGAADDPMEREADAVADKIIQRASAGSTIQRCPACEAEDENGIAADTAVTVRMKTGTGSSTGAQEASSGLVQKIESSRGKGETLDTQTRASMQNGFGTDFSSVTIHTGSEAVQMSRSLNAKAFTVGNDIYFNEGQYQPSTTEGKHLLAHELTHTIQQSDGGGAVQRTVSPNLSDIRDLLSYGIFDWAITDGDVHRVLGYLRNLNDTDLEETLAALGSEKINRLIENLAESSDRNVDWVGELMGRVYRLGHVALNTGNLRNQLSYGVFDWAITDTDVSTVLLYLRYLNDTELTQAVNELNNGGYIEALFENLAESSDRNQQWVGELLERMTRLGNLTWDISKLRDHLTYGFFDWAVTDTDVSAVLLYLRFLDDAQLASTVAELERGGLIDRLIDNLDESDDRNVRWVQRLMMRIQDRRVRKRDDGTSYVGSCTPGQIEQTKGRLPRVVDWARMMIDAIINFAIPGASSENLERMLERYFFHQAQAGTLTRDQQQEFADFIISKVTTMKNGASSTDIRCASQFDPLCGVFDAYASGGTILRVCQSYFRMNENEQVSMLFHELMHFYNSDVDDTGYQWERVFEYLPPDRAVRNADSYSSFVEELVLHRPSSGMRTQRDSVEACTVVQEQNLRRDIAFAMRMIGNARNEISSASYETQNSNSAATTNFKVSHQDELNRFAERFKHHHIPDQIHFRCTAAGGALTGALPYTSGDGLPLLPQYFTISNENQRVVTLLAILFRRFGDDLGNAVMPSETGYATQTIDQAYRNPGAFAGYARDISIRPASEGRQEWNFADANIRYGEEMARTTNPVIDEFNRNYSDDIFESNFLRFVIPSLEEDTTANPINNHQELEARTASFRQKAELIRLFLDRIYRDYERRDTDNTLQLILMFDTATLSESHIMEVAETRFREALVSLRASFTPILRRIRNGETLRFDEWTDYPSQLSNFTTTSQQTLATVLSYRDYMQKLSRVHAEYRRLNSTLSQQLADSSISFDDFAAASTELMTNSVTFSRGIDNIFGRIRFRCLNGIPFDPVASHLPDPVALSRRFQQQIRNITRGAMVHRKLAIGSVDDPLEREADAMADQVVRRAPAPAVQRKCAACEQEEQLQFKPALSRIQRSTAEEEEMLQMKCAACEQEEQLQLKPVLNRIQRSTAEEEEMLQMKCAACGEEDKKLQRSSMPSFLQKKEAEASPGITSRIQSSRGNGSSLPDDVRSSMEKSFAADFSDVRIHTGQQAAQLSTDLNAQAFTVGRDIYFNQGKYAPSTADGKHLLAHELTHTIQQGAAGAEPVVQRKKLKDEEKTLPAKIYETAIPQNLENWETRDRFYNIFADVPYEDKKGIFPGSTPNAYVNHVYDLQQKLKTLWQADYRGSLNGIVDDQLITDLQTIADFYAQNKKALFAAYGIDTLILERFLRIKRNVINNPPLRSGLANYDALNLINQNSLFGVAINDTGKHVLYLKKVLYDMNYLSYEEVNDRYDEKTVSVIKKFQEDTGMEKKDGITGANTLQILDKYLTNDSTVFIIPGSRFIARGTLADNIVVYTDGNGDQKKELRLTFSKKGAEVLMKIYHLDTSENRGPYRFSFPDLDLNGRIWVHEYVMGNGLNPTQIKLESADKKADTTDKPAAEDIITIYPPSPDAPGRYRFNDYLVDFNVRKFKPLYGFSEGDQVVLTNPTFQFFVGPYGDIFKLFFKSGQLPAAEDGNPTDARIYDAELYLMALGNNNMAYGSAPLKLKLKSNSLSIGPVRNQINVMGFDLDGDGVEDIDLHYSISQAQSEQRADHNRFINLFFNGPALEKQQTYRFEKIGDYWVIHEVKSEEYFKQLVAAIGNERLNQQEIPPDRSQDINILNNLLSQFYLKALEEDIIKSDTYLAWKKLDISLQYLKMFVAGHAQLTPDDNEKIRKAADFADEYLALIRRDTKGKEKISVSAMPSKGGGAGSSTINKWNLYTGDSETTTTTIAGGISSKTETNLGAEIRQQKWGQAEQTYNKLADGFNLWVADQLREKHPDDTTLSAQTRGAYKFAERLKDIVGNPDNINLTRVKAVYFSYEKYKTEKSGLPSVDLPLYYYYNTKSRKWWVADFINPSAPYFTHVELGSDEIPGDKPPASLFQKLNDKDHLPKGMLLYSGLENTVSGQVELTEPWEWKDVLAWFSAAVGIAALIGSMIFTAGGTTPLAIEVMFAISALAGGISAGMDLYEHYKNEDLTPMTALLDIGNIVASAVGLSAMSSGKIIVLASRASLKGTPWVGNWARLALAADKAYIPLVGLNIGANAFNIAVLTKDTIDKLDEIDKAGGDQASRDRAKILLLGQLAFAGGLTILSLKGDIASLSRGTNIVIYPGKNGIPVAASAAEGIKALPVEELSLRNQDEFDQILSIREQLFGKAASTEISKVSSNKAFMKEYAQLNKEIFEILNNPTLDVAAKKQQLAAKIEAFDKLVASEKLLDKSVFDTAKVKEMAAALEEDNFGMRMTLKDGTVNMQGVELGKFPELVERVKVTNESMKANGSDQELVIIIMPSITPDAPQEIMILSRKRWNIPSGAKPSAGPVSIGKANPAHKQYIVDVGAGTNSFAIDMIPAADRQGNTVLNTEYAPTFMEPAMTRSSLTWKNAAAKTDPNTVVIIGDPLVNLNEMVGDKSVRQLYLNNVNAHYNEDQYAHLAEQLVKSMDSGGRVDLQWTDELEKAKTGEMVSRGHIEDKFLWPALEKAAKDAGRTVTPLGDLPVADYNYGITPSKEVAVTPDKPLTEAQRKGVTDPVPKFHKAYIFN